MIIFLHQIKNEENADRASYSMTKFTVKSTHQIHLWQGIDFGLKIGILCPFYKSQVKTFDILQVIEEKLVFDDN